MSDGCVVVILTFNCELIISETVRQAKKITDSVYVVDSFSKDGTVDIARAEGCQVVQRAFLNYSEQRNWAISQIESKYKWQLHLDADEVLDDVAIGEISDIVGKNFVSSKDAYLIRRRDYFLGKMLKFSGVNPWHLRLFKSGVGKCENRLYDQHFVATVDVGKLAGWMHDKNMVSLSDWTVRHNRWAELEAEESQRQVAEVDGVLQARLFGDSRERTRYLKKIYYKLPGGLRVLSYFLYRYIVRLGFLDGRVGFYFAFFQAFWFRMLVDAKVFEKNMTEQ